MRRPARLAKAQSRGSPRFYLPELDLIRFAAFLLVFSSHVVPGEPGFYQQAGIPAPVATAIVSMAAGGAFGVDLFFALSSFLITTLLLQEREVSGQIDVVAFYLRRVLRIWPLYFTFLFIVAPLVRTIIPDDRLPTRDSVAFALLVGNWAFVKWGYAHSIVGPLWSVSVEEQFYLLCPPLPSSAAAFLGALARCAPRRLVGLDYNSHGVGADGSGASANLV